MHLGQLRTIEQSQTLLLNEQSRQLEDAGREVFKFGFGQSPFPPLPMFGINPYYMALIQGREHRDPTGRLLLPAMPPSEPLQALVVPILAEADDMSGEKDPFIARRNPQALWLSDYEDRILFDGRKAPEDKYKRYVPLQRDVNDSLARPRRAGSSA